MKKRFARFPRPLPRPLAPFAAVLPALALAACGSLTDMGGNNSVDPRRVYVNDPARNDSLVTALPGRGLVFVMQPGEPYDLRMHTRAEGQQILFYVPSDGNTFVLKESLSGTREGDVVSFPLAPTRSTPAYYLAFLRSASGGRASRPDSGVRLVPRDTARSQRVAVRLLMVGRLTSRLGPGYMGDAEKSQYARAFHTELMGIYAAHGFTIDTSTVVVAAGDSPFVVDFGGPTEFIPGERLEGGVNMYLVDDIRYDGTGTILGFAPREAFDLSGDPESQVVLNVRGTSAAAAAVTAAHEMGHFLGLRHTSATAADRDWDDDDSNRDDGFPSTPFCSALEKRPVGDPGAPATIIRRRGGRAYCLRTAGTAYTCNCPDVANLMYPYACGSVTQKSLGEDQKRFVGSNLRLYQSGQAAGSP